MNAEHLVHDVQALMPNASQFEVLQMAYLVSVETKATDRQDSSRLAQVVEEIRPRLRIASDQFAAVAHELSGVGRFDPCKFSPTQLWSLLRSIKVHSQLLQLYMGRFGQTSSALG
jgi:hypothetical protein